MKPPVLQVTDLHKSFPTGFFSPPKEILKGVRFSLPKGSLTAFLGANGSGKTTTFKCLFNLIKRDRGEIKVFGKTHLDPETKSAMGFLPERPRFCEDLTAEELLVFFGQLSSPSGARKIKERVKDLLREFDMFEFRREKLRTFSKGMIQKVGIIQALVSEPALLILDEPFAGLDPESRGTVMDWIEKIHRQKGVTVCFSSHIFQDVERLCNRLLVISDGKIVFEGAISDFARRIQGGRNILFLQNGVKKSLLVSNLSECQKEIQRLQKQDCVILSVNLQLKNPSDVYEKLSEKGGGCSG